MRDVERGSDREGRHAGERGINSGAKLCSEGHTYT